MTKWQSIAAAIMVMSIFGALAIESLSDNNSDNQKAIVGLEECSQSIDSIRTIWVKDCIAYTTTLHKYKED